MSRAEHLERFYELLRDLEHRTGGTRLLETANGRMDWPTRGVYFFFEPGETSSFSERRVVRVGTHGLKANSKSTLWGRLAQHQGVIRSGAGSHRGSIFRLIIGASLIRRDNLAIPSWGVASDIGSAARKLGVDRSTLKESEKPLEILVSHHIRKMPFDWLSIEDAPGPESLRGYIERNSIALLSNFNKEPIDTPSSNWLGKHCDRYRVRESGLWNNNHVDECYDPQFLDTLSALVSTTK